MRLISSDVLIGYHKFLILSNQIRSAVAIHEINFINR